MSPCIEMAAVPDALMLNDAELVSIVGGGGKTTTLFTLGSALAGRVIVTTTTKMGSDRTDGYPVLLRPTDADLRAHFADAPRALVWTDRGEHRADGVDPRNCDHWFGTVADHVVVEADGSRRRPFKAPETYEPVIPSRSTLVIACIGAGALGQSIRQGCHRIERVAALAGCTIDDILTPDRAAAVLTHPDGSRKNVPEDARFAVVIHQCDDNNTQAAELAALLEPEVMVLRVQPVDATVGAKSRPTSH